jgi:hypothetical protein
MSKFTLLESEFVSPHRVLSLESAPATEATEGTERDRVLRARKKIDCVSIFAKNWP